MDSVKQIIFVTHDRNGIVMLRITRVHKIHEEAHLVDIVPRLDCPMPKFQVSRAELEEQDTFFAIWCQCQGQGILHVASHLAGIPFLQLRSPLLAYEHGPSSEGEYTVDFKCRNKGLFVTKQTILD